MSEISPADERLARLEGHFLPLNLVLAQKARCGEDLLGQQSNLACDEPVVIGESITRMKRAQQIGRHPDELVLLVGMKHPPNARAVELIVIERQILLLRMQVEMTKRLLVEGEFGANAKERNGLHGGWVGLLLRRESIVPWTSIDQRGSIVVKFTRMQMTNVVGCEEIRPHGNQSIAGCS